MTNTFSSKILSSKYFCRPAQNRVLALLGGGAISLAGCSSLSAAGSSLLSPDWLELALPAVAGRVR